MGKGEIMLINKRRLREYVKAQGRAARVSDQYIDLLNARLKYIIKHGLALPSNRKTLRDFI